MTSPTRVLLLSLLAAALTAPAFAQAPPKPEIAVQADHAGPVNDLAFTSDGRFLLTGSEDASVKLWDSDTGYQIRTSPAYSRAIDKVATDADGRFFAAGMHDAIIVFDLKTGRELISAGGLWDMLAGRSVSLSPDGKTLAVGTWGKKVSVRGLKDGKELKSLEGFSEPVYATVFSADGKLLATGTQDGRIKVWDCAAWSAVREFSAGEGPIHGLAITPDKKLLVSSYKEKTVVWDIETGQVLREHKTHPNVVKPAAVSPDGRFLALMDSPYTIRVLELGTGKEARELEWWDKSRELMVSVSFSRDGRRLAAGSHGGAARVWDLETGQALRTYGSRSKHLASVAMSPDGNWLAVGVTDLFNEDRTVRLWDLASGAQSAILRGHEKSVHLLAFTPDSRELLAGSWNGSIKRWDPATGESVGTLHGPEGTAGMALSPDGRFLALANRSKGAQVWDLTQGSRIGAWDAVEEDVRAVAFTPDGSGVVTGGLRGKARLRAVATAAEVRSFDAYPSEVMSVAVSPDGRSLLVGSTETAKLLDLATGEETRTLSYSGKVNAIAFTTDSAHAVLASSYNKAIYYRLEDGWCLKYYAGHSGEVGSIALSADGGLVATAGQSEGAVRFWRIGYRFGENLNAPGDEVLRLVTMGEDWVAYTPAGFFDGSPGGMKSLRWTVGLESYPLESFSEGYYTPGLLARVLRNEAVGSAKTPSLSEGFRLPPSVTIVSPKDGASVTSDTLEVTVSAEDRGGGVDEVRLYHNDKAVGTDTRDIKVSAKNGKTRTVVFSVSLVDGENRFRAVALSKDRIEGNPASATVTLRGPEKEASLTVLAVGINEYRNSALDLNYARPDALAVENAFVNASGPLFKETRRRELFDAAATKAAILAELDGLKAAPPQDVVVIYMAGHGVTIDDAWYFIPYELAYPEREAEVKAKGLSSDELQAAIRKVGAQKVLLLLDACKAGGALLAFAGRGVEERKALSMLARAAGVHVVAASSKDQLASEVKDLGHGVFTHVLLQAVAGKADANPKDGAVTVRELLTYVESELPEVSRKYKAQAQFPVVDSRGMDFPVAGATR